jgi:putative oxidoreductase
VRAAGGWRRRAREVSDLPARVALGSVLLYHGISKLRGDGPQQTGQMFESLGIRPGRPWAIAAGLAESFAGAGAMLGIATRPAALAIMATQGVAIWKVHAPKGFNVMQGGMEYNLLIVSLALEMLLQEPGPLTAHQITRRLALRRRPVRAAWRRLRPSVADRALALLH